MRDADVLCEDIVREVFNSNLAILSGLGNSGFVGFALVLKFLVGFVELGLERADIVVQVVWGAVVAIVATSVRRTGDLLELKWC